MVAIILTHIISSISVEGRKYRGNYCKDDNVDFFFSTLKCKITFLTLTIFN